MNFFEQQAQARSQSRWLLAAFLLSVLVVLLAITALVSFAFALQAQPLAADGGVTMPGWPALRAELRPGLVAGGAMLVVILLATLYKTARLREGGAAVARQLGGRAVTPASREPAERRLHNVVEEIAIASGVPVPQVFVLEHEAGINAFAAGFGAADAAIAVTRGALEKLSRDELQGVIAHEFSHVLNGDMRLNIRLMGLAFGLLVLHVVGREILVRAPRFGGGDKKGGALVLLAFALALTVLGGIGLVSARLIKARIARTREYLADASAVQFTRQTLGLAGALKKIAGVKAGSRLATPDAEEVSHMLFGEGDGRSGLFATHPPLLERIRRLEPNFSEAQLRLEAQRWNAPGYDAAMAGDVAAGDGSAGLTDEQVAAVAALAGGVIASAPPSVARTTDAARGGPAEEAGAVATTRVSPAAVVAQVAHPDAADYRHAEWLRGELPAALRAAAEGSDTAGAVLLALLLDDARTHPVVTKRLDEAAPSAPASPRLVGVLSAQAEADVRRTLGDEAFARVQALRPGIAALARSQHLPLAGLAFAALRQRPELELRILQSLTTRLTLVDGEVQPFEFALGHLLRVQLVDWFAPAEVRAVGTLRLDAALNAAERVLRLLAVAGSGERAAVDTAFAQGWRHLYPARTPPPATAAADRYVGLDAALARLDRLDGAGKQALLEAMVAVIAHDGRTTVGEAELLRVVAASLHCPLPPLLHDDLAGAEAPTPLAAGAVGDSDRVDTRGA